MDKKLLEVNHLTVAFQTDDGEMTAVKDVSLSLKEGEILALVGESGCGKTVLCKAMLQVLCGRGMVKQGEVFLEDTRILTLNEKQMQEVRGKGMAMIFQDPMTSLNPTMPIGRQIMEVVQAHNKEVSVMQAKQRTYELLALVGIEEPERRFSHRPYQFSGGMRQRVAIAIALAGNPKLLLADEPTTALDLATQQQMITLLKNIQKETKAAIIFITHDLGLVEDLADRVCVMAQGKIVEEGTLEQVFYNPQAEYTKKLLRYLDYSKAKGHTHGKIHFHHGHVHAHEHAAEKGHDHEISPLQVGEVKGLPETGSLQKKEPLVSVRNLKMYFKPDRHTTVKAVDDVSMNIDRGEIVGLIGRSGCGKSTLARCIMNLYQPTQGNIEYIGNNKQIIFQDSASSLNPRMTLFEIIEEPLKLQKKLRNKEARREKVFELMELAELDKNLATRYPYLVSGGQRQRTAIARAIATDPDLIVADEPIASLDVSIQAQIVHLFKRLSEQKKLAILFIAHDVPMVMHISDRILYMEKGKMIAQNYEEMEKRW